jgi:hypothetical protein
MELLVVVVLLHRLPPWLQLVLWIVELLAEVFGGVLAHPVFL